MIAHKYHVEFVTIVLESFQVCYYLFFHRSAILVDSTQSFFLWNYYKWHFGFRIKVFWNSGQSVELSSSFETAIYNPHPHRLPSKLTAAIQKSTHPNHNYIPTRNWSKCWSNVSYNKNNITKYLNGNFANVIDRIRVARIARFFFYICL